MDAELHLSTLVHVCGHLFVKIQKELEEMQRRDVQTQIVETLQLLANRMVL